MKQLADERLHVRLSNGLKRKAAGAAGRRGLSLSKFVRLAIVRLVAQDNRKDSNNDD